MTIKPPKKRKLALPAKVGKIRQYLTDNFSIFPEELKNFKNGHVLLQYIINDSSTTMTRMAVMKKLPSCVINLSQLQSLLTQAKKFKNLRRDSEMEKYTSLCNQLFNPVNEDPEPETSKLEHFDSKCLSYLFCEIREIIKSFRILNVLYIGLSWKLTKQN